MTTDIFEDFDEESQKLLERLQGNMLTFQDIGQARGLRQVQARNSGTGYDGVSQRRWGSSPNGTNPDGTEPNLCGAFEDDFDSRGINYDRLAKDIKDNLYSLKGLYFDYRNYAQNDISSNTTFSSPTTMIPTGGYSSKNDTPFTYTDEAGNSKTGIFRTGRQNKRICYVDAYNVGINFSNNNVIYSFTLPYKDAAGKELVYDGSTPQEDFFRKDKYVALEISDTEVGVFLGFIKAVFGDSHADACKALIVSYFNNFFLKNNTDVDRLKVLYEQAPDFVLKELLGLLGKETLWSHFTLLSDYDDKGFFSNFRDASSAFINVLKAFGNSALLYDKLKGDPKLVKRIYVNLDKSSEYMGQVLSNRIIFSYLLNALCIANGFKDLTILDKTFYHGEGYTLDANVTGASEKDDEFFIQQMREIPLMGIDFLPFTEELEEDSGRMYHPLDMVSFVDKSTQDEFVMLVPAILVKALSDEEEWQEINRNIRIGFDILAIIVGVITVATTGNPGLFALAVADIALATTDVVVQGFHEEIMQLEGGPEFIATWEKIYIVGGIITAGPFLVAGILKSGSALLRIAQAAKNFKVANFVRSCMMKVILEINIANFTKNTVKEIIYAEEALKLSGVNFKMAGVTRLQQEGVLFIKGIDAEGKAVGYAAIYKGVPIANGTAKEVREILKDLWLAKGQSLIDALETLWKRTPKLDDAKRYWIATNEAGNDLRWVNQLPKNPSGAKIDSIINDAIKSGKTDKVFEGETARNIQALEEDLGKITDFSNKIYPPKGTNIAEIDVRTEKYLFELKKRIDFVTFDNPKRLEEFMEQFRRYTDSKHANYVNLGNKKVVLVLGELDARLTLQHTVFRQLREMGVVIITDLKQLKKIK